MSIMQYNGSAIVAMKGETGVAIACDNRFGVQLSTIGTENRRVIVIHSKLMIGLSGLMTDVQTVGNILKFRHSLYKLREGRNMSCQTFTKVVSNLLYSKRFSPYFVEPIIVGLDENDNNKPYIASMDLIGATEVCDGFACVGTTEEELYGMSEALWTPKMDNDQLFENISQSMLSGTDRDCLAGWGSTVYLIGENATTISQLKHRQD